MKRAVLGIGLLLLLALGLFWLVNPLGFVMLYGAIFGYGIPSHPPAIVGNVPLKWPNKGESEPNWTAILRQKFPVGSDEAVLEAALNDQGFKIDRQKQSAEYEWGGLPCTYHLSAEWKTNAAKKINWVNGKFFPACL